MKRDMDLVREILLEIEREYQGLAIRNFSIEGYDKTTVAEHCKMLYEYGIIDRFSTSPADNDPYYMYAVGNLTWEGYDYLEKIRDNTVWGKIKATFIEKGIPLLIDTVKTAADIYIEASIKTTFGLK